MTLETATIWWLYGTGAIAVFLKFVPNNKVPMRWAAFGALAWPFAIWVSIAGGLIQIWRDWDDI